MKIQFLPLDDRPCNEAYIRHLYELSDKVNVEGISLSCLGNKKTPTKWENIKKFLNTSCHYDAAVLSLDMFFYGGLVPSRLHRLTSSDLDEKFSYLIQYLKENEKTKVYAFQTLMRTPHYNSSEEEPDYYEQYGEKLFKLAYLKDKKQRKGLNVQEKKELSEIFIPLEILEDYESRRAFNLNVLEKTLELVKKGAIDFLVIPQDDSSEYGYTAQDQRKIYRYIEKYQLWDRVMIYPGADEVALSLISRAILEYMDKTFCIYPFYASILGPQIVPLYEDRPMYETLKSHLHVIGINLARSIDEADYVLAINSPGHHMAEAFDQKDKDVTYTSYRNLSTFIHQIEQLLKENKNVALLDTAYANGGDLELVQRLDQKNILSSICAYSAWNTHANSLGTILSMLSIMYVEEDIEKFKSFSLCYRLVEDLLYQSKVRQEVIKTTLPKFQASYYNFNNHQSEIEKAIYNRLKVLYETMCISRVYPFTIKKVYTPWKRMFEIGME